VKVFGGQAINAGSIIIRQRGSVYRAGTNVGMGRDHTLFALITGKVMFNRRTGGKMFVSVQPVPAAAE